MIRIISSRDYSSCVYIGIGPCMQADMNLVNRCVILLSRYVISIYYEANLTSLFCWQSSSLEDGACLGGLLDTRLTHVHYVNAQEGTQL